MLLLLLYSEDRYKNIKELMRERDRKKFKSTEAFYFDLKLVILRLEMREIKQVIYRSLKKKRSIWIIMCYSETTEQERKDKTMLKESANTCEKVV